MSQSEGLSELEALQIKANSVVDESLESTRRMIAMCEEVSRGGGELDIMNEKIQSKTRQGLAHTNPQHETHTNPVLYD